MNTDNLHDTAILLITEHGVITSLARDIGVKIDELCYKAPVEITCGIYAGKFGEIMIVEEHELRFSIRLNTDEYVTVGFGEFNFM